MVTCLFASAQEGNHKAEKVTFSDCDAYENVRRKRQRQSCSKGTHDFFVNVALRRDFAHDKNACKYLCAIVRMSVFMCVCVCLHVCMYLCMCVCMISDSLCGSYFNRGN
jgi:hypothetical protein